MSNHASMTVTVQKSKTLTAGLAFAFGSLGAHRFYLYGLRDHFGWAHLLGTALGAAGWGALITSELQSIPGWAMAICGAASLFSAFLAAIVYGLRPDARWDAQFNHGQRTAPSGWAAVLIVIGALFIGALLLMTGLAIAFQTYFEATMPANRLTL